MDINYDLIARNTAKPFAKSSTFSIEMQDPEDFLSGEDLEGNNTLGLQRVHVKDQNALLGRVGRHFITGNVMLNGSIDQERDFNFVDLYTRDYIMGTPEEIAKDPYLFKPIPLRYHTWFWHHTVEEMIKGNKVADAEDHGVWGALSLSGVDFDAKAGLWSPVRIYAPGVVGVILTQNFIVVIAHVLVTLITFILSVKTNIPAGFGYGRLASLPFRFALLVVSFYFLAKDLSDEFNILVLIGYLLHVAVVPYEIVRGDLLWVGSAAYACSYRLLKKLSDDVWVCHRQGGGQAQEFFGGHTRIPMEVTGVPPDSETALVANIQGLLVELKPLNDGDGEALLEFKYDAGRAAADDSALLRYFGTDLYDEQYPTAYHLDRKTKVVGTEVDDIIASSLDNRQTVAQLPPSGSQTPSSFFATPREHALRSQARAEDKMVLQEVDEEAGSNATW